MPTPPIGLKVTFFILVHLLGRAIDVTTTDPRRRHGEQADKKGNVAIGQHVAVLTLIRALIETFFQNRSGQTRGYLIRPLYQRFSQTIILARSI